MHYRYGYQGEFAETDTETGMPAFELRIYDPRLGRWLNPDPMGQYHSPYMAMDNTPQMSVDPTGGCTVGTDCPDEFNWMQAGTTVLDEFIGTPDGSFGGVNWFSDSITGGGFLDFSQQSLQDWESNFNARLRGFSTQFKGLVSRAMTQKNMPLDMNRDQKLESVAVDTNGDSLADSYISPNDKEEQFDTKGAIKFGQKIGKYGLKAIGLFGKAGNRMMQTQATNAGEDYILERRAYDLHPIGPYRQLDSAKLTRVGINFHRNFHYTKNPGY